MNAKDAAKIAAPVALKLEQDAYEDSEIELALLLLQVKQESLLGRFHVNITPSYSGITQGKLNSLGYYTNDKRNFIGWEPKPPKKRFRWLPIGFG